MKEQFVTQKIALALKELGFDKPCFGGWSDTGKWCYHPDSDIILDAPLWQQAINWLKKSKGILVNLSPSSTANDNQITHWIFDIYLDGYHKYMSKDYTTSREAVKEGVLKAIKLYTKKN